MICFVKQMLTGLNKAVISACTVCAASCRVLCLIRYKPIQASVVLQLPVWCCNAHRPSQYAACFPYNSRTVLVSFFLVNKQKSQWPYTASGP